MFAALGPAELERLARTADEESVSPSVSQTRMDDLGM
jgi:hypothetical protein